MLALLDCWEVSETASHSSELYSSDSEEDACEWTARRSLLPSAASVVVTAMPLRRLEGQEDKSWRQVAAAIGV